MEDILDQYENRSIQENPCLDEQPYQLLDDTRPFEPAMGKVYEYRRCGTCSIFVAVEPKGGKRFVQSSASSRRADFARFVRDLLQRYPKAIWLDNLNTHNGMPRRRNCCNAS